MNTSLSIILLGPPIVGKGSLAVQLSTALNVPHIAVGKLLHERERANRDSRINDAIAKGELVSDEVVIAVVSERLAQDDCAPGFIIDGYPRTRAQAEQPAVVANANYIFLITASEELLIERARGRRVCPNGHSWNLNHLPPRDPNVCDICGEPLVARADDQPEIVHHRLARYRDEIAPIQEFYQTRIIELDGRLSPAELCQQVVARINHTND